MANHRYPVEPEPVGGGLFNSATLVAGLLAAIMALLVLYRLFTGLGLSPT